MSVFSAWISSLTPVVTLSRSPTLPFLPLLLPPLEFFSSAIRFRSELFETAFCVDLNARQERSGIIKVRGLSLGPLIQARSVYDDLSIRSQFDLRAIHGAWCRPFKVNSFAVVAAAMARAFEFVFARLPIGSAAQMCAARVNDKEPIGSAVDPYTIFLLEFCVDAKREF